MGETCSRPQVVVPISDLEDKLQKEARDAKSHHKLFCLGTGESGKSTMVKQLKFIFKDSLVNAAGAEPMSPASFVHVLHSNTIESMLKILHEIDRKQEEFSNPQHTSQARQLKAEYPSLDAIQPGVHPVRKLTPKFADMIYDLWMNAPLVQRTFHNSTTGTYWVSDNAPYFFENCQRFARSGFEPTETDIIRARKKTTGVICTDIADNLCRWTVVDVGGQRSERRKWVNWFSDVKCILYFVDVSGYDRNIHEDRNRSSLEESLQLFAETMRNPVFSRTPVILMFNKIDLLRQKQLPSARTLGIRDPITYFPASETFSAAVPSPPLLPMSAASAGAVAVAAADATTTEASTDATAAAAAAAAVSTSAAADVVATAASIAASDVADSSTSAGTTTSVDAPPAPVAASVEALSDPVAALQVADGKMTTRSVEPSDLMAIEERYLTLLTDRFSRALTTPPSTPPGQSDTTSSIQRPTLPVIRLCCIDRASVREAFHQIQKFTLNALKTEEQTIPLSIATPTAANTASRSPASHRNVQRKQFVPAA